MRELQLIIYCDSCDDIISEDETYSVFVVYPDGREYEADSCSQCTPLQAFTMREKMRGKTAKGDETFPCSQCDREFSTIRGLNQHRTKTHGA